MAIELRWASVTDSGRVRDLNEDSILVTSELFAVADGMGGHAAGEVASRIAIEALRAHIAPTPEGVVEAIRIANRSIFDQATADPEQRGMGTTLSVLAQIPGADGEDLVIANVGDSRVYRLHLGELEQLSEDHSLVEDLVREGRISPAEARVHPNRNIVTRAVGIDANVDIDHWVVTPATGDRYLLCSDGLSDEIDDSAIAQVLRTERDPEAAVRRLVDMANAAGGRDNISVVIVDVVDDGGRAEAASASLAGDRSGTRAQPVVHEVPSAPPVESPTGVVSVVPDADILPRHRRITWRVVVFLVAILLVVVGGIGGTIWFARNTYYVGVNDDDVVTVYRGRPGGVLWLDPTVEEETEYHLDDIEPARHDELRGGHEVSSVDKAERYVENITTTTTTSTTTTTAPPATTVPAPTQPPPP